MTDRCVDLARLISLSESAPAGRLVLATSCSWRRILTERSGTFLVPTVDLDGHPNLDTTPAAEFVTELVNWFRDNADALVAEAQREVVVWMSYSAATGKPVFDTEPPDEPNVAGWRPLVFGDDETTRQRLPEEVINRAVFLAIVSCMESDNGCEFVIERGDFERAQRAIAALRAAGFFAGNPDDLDSDYWIAAGAHSEDEAVEHFRHVADIYEPLNEVLQEIFDRPPPGELEVATDDAEDARLFRALFPDEKGRALAREALAAVLGKEADHG